MGGGTCTSCAFVVRYMVACCTWPQPMATGQSLCVYTTTICPISTITCILVQVPILYNDLSRIVE
ncbi:hypothetical protein QJS10_CPA06g02556 [Acorus calamus]|uniref:Uncharacterized protein n=1 Tax=Acorus calamus TaxID=4465 RepID=A0AAV9ELL0_ACOCL|nr:hypothetical protein QJS10_CPA06g02556 [Acorus calamus]